MHLLLSLCFTLLLGVSVIAERKLEFVQAIWRHGDRAPLHYPYPNDKYTESYWPRGWGELTNIGMNQLYELGQYFRKHYGSIVSEHFHKHQVYIYSSDSDRALTSANSMLAGLYPAKDNYQWQHGNAWQPVPVHTTPEKMDDFLTRGCDLNCKRAEDNAKRDIAADKVKVDKECGDMYSSLEKWTGIKNFGYKNFNSVYNAYREIQNNLAQPEWVHRRWPKHHNMTTLEIADKLRIRKSLSEYGSQATGPYYGGYLVNDFVKHSQQVANGTKSKPTRFLGYSSHDDEIMSFQAALGVQNGLEVPYASAMILEIYSNTINGVKQFEAELLYRNTTLVAPYKLKMPRCGTPCLVSKLAQIYKNVMISSVNEAKKRCGN